MFHELIVNLFQMHAGSRASNKSREGNLATTVGGSPNVGVQRSKLQRCSDSGLCLGNVFFGGTPKIG